MIGLSNKNTRLQKDGYRYKSISKILAEILVMLVVMTLFGYLYLPLVGISHDDASALIVVLSNAHLCHVVGAFDAQRLIDLVLLPIIQNVR